MCLIALAWRVRADLPLLLLANRDEFRDRPWAPAARWGEPPMLAGRDLKAGGTWLGLADDGRFAAVTNVRDPQAPAGRRSRGEWVQRVLAAPSLAAIETSLSRDSGDYGGFNLLFGSAEALYSWHSPSRTLHTLTPGIHALSNADLDTRWPKVVAARTALAALLAADTPIGSDDWWGALGSTATPPGELPDTGIGRDWEQRLAPAVITGARYGTLSRNLLRWHADGRVDFAERVLDEHGAYAAAVVPSSAATPC
jgi:uncharacterized protein with NRDE domain